MPNLRVHCLLTEQRYGVTGRDIHKWMDEPVKLYGPTHRIVRHNKYQELPQQFIEQYGAELAYNIMLDHLLADEKTPDGLPTDTPRRIKPRNMIQKEINVIKFENQTDLTPEELTGRPDYKSLPKRERLLAILAEVRRIQNCIAELENKMEAKQ